MAPANERAPHRSAERRWPTLARSFRAQLWLLWLFIVLLCAAMAIILVGLYQSSAGVQIEAGRRATRAACETIQSLYAANIGRPTPTMDRDLLAVLLKEVLTDAPGVEGGFWDREAGFTAYAFPTHEGATPKEDVPAAEAPWIVENVEHALAEGRMSEAVRRGSREAVLLAACPLTDSSQIRAAWTMTRVRTATSEAYGRLAWGLALLLAFALLSGGWLAFTLSRWSRAITGLEKTIQRHPVGELPIMERSGNADIDRIVDALNTFTHRLTAARLEASTLSTRLAQTERLAALGRIAAGVAHEIRNPIAAMRLKAENALVHSPDRQAVALQTVLDQIDRLDVLCESLLSLGRPLRLDERVIELKDWLEMRLRAFAERAGRDGIHLEGHAPATPARFDPDQLGRALDNLILNALQHTPRGGAVSVAIEISAANVRTTVADTGEGIAEAMRGTLFEPFATGRPGGTGLGLAIAREIAEAHGGVIRLAPSDKGAVFEMDIPWRAS